MILHEASRTDMTLIVMMLFRCLSPPHPSHLSLFLPLLFISSRLRKKNIFFFSLFPFISSTPSFSPFSSSLFTLSPPSLLQVKTIQRHRLVVHGLVSTVILFLSPQRELKNVLSRGKTNCSSFCLCFLFSPSQYRQSIQKRPSH